MTDSFTTSAEDGYIAGVTGSPSPVGVFKTGDDIIVTSSSSMATTESQGFFFFDISSLPAGAIVSAVRLKAYLNSFVGVIENGSEVVLFFRDNGTTLDTTDFDNGGSQDGVFCNDSFFDPQLITYTFAGGEAAVSGALASGGRLGIRLECFNVTTGDPCQWAFDSFEKSGGIPAVLEIDYTLPSSVSTNRLLVGIGT